MLSKWRAAERELGELTLGSPEWTAVQAEIEHFRTEYQRLARGERERIDGRKDSSVG